MSELSINGWKLFQFDTDALDGFSSVLELHMKSMRSMTEFWTKTNSFKLPNLAIANIWWPRMSEFFMKGEVEWNTELPVNGWKSFQFNTDALLMGLAWCWNSAWHQGPWKNSGLKLTLLSCWTLAKIISPSALPLRWSNRQHCLFALLFNFFSCLRVIFNPKEC